MSGVITIRERTVRQGSEAEVVSGGVAAAILPASAETGGMARHGDDRTSDWRHGAGHLLPKRRNSLGAFVIANGAARSSPSSFRDSSGAIVEFDLCALVHATVAMLRRHPHISNVLTHVSGAHWERIVQALGLVLNPLATPGDLSPLARDLVDLICAERGTTGCILKPYFHAVLDKVLPPPTAAYLRAHVFGLYLALEARRSATPVNTETNPAIAA